MPHCRSGSRLPSYSALRPWLRYHSGQLIKPAMLTEAIVEILNELKDAVMTHDIKIIFVGWDSKVLSKINMTFQAGSIFWTG
jgi:hypothetical protein